MSNNKIKLVVEVDEYCRDAIIRHRNGTYGAQLPYYIISSAFEAIANGTPLPKEHGRLGDLDAVMNDISTSINAMTKIGITIDGDYLWAKLNDAIDNATTIVEADKENDNE